MPRQYLIVYNYFVIELFLLSKDIYFNIFISLLPHNFYLVVPFKHEIYFPRV